LFQEKRKHRDGNWFRHNMPDAYEPAQRDRKATGGGCPSS
jgi:hypothetical protein